ncbi:MAG TPA: DUF4175 domain-containing protein [Polyangiaceae bacterium]|nr:DUF4175 domain-containing protein [Polyangiaceae bacterium]
MRRASVLGAVAALALGAHLARLGVPSARGGAALLVAAAVVGAVALAVRRRRALASLQSVLERVVRPADAEGAGRALRALRLVERARVEPSVGSAELAALHLDRSLGRISVERVRGHAERLAKRSRRAGLLAAALAVGAVTAGPVRVLEGLDVLASRGGLAPLPIDYLEGVEVLVHPPEYLHERDRSYVGVGELEAPYGSVVTVRGEPLRAGRALVLGDGNQEVPFVDDGQGRVTARWTLAGDAPLRVGARFGPVRVEQAEGLLLRSRPDEAPVVEVEGAPRTARLLEESEIPLVYRASDDHGLRQLDLVLRSGAREERRPLARFDSDRRRDQGGYLLRASDRFLKDSYAPIEVRVEARDNDPLTGPKWGKSEAVTIVPPALGEPEALRHDALAAVRAAFVDALAAAADKRGAAAEREAVDRALEAAREVTGKTFGGLSLARRTGSLVLGQARRVRDAAKGGRAKLVPALEDASLAVDGALRSLGARDARSVARRLSRVAEDAADGLHAAQAPAERAAGRTRAEAALEVIAPSGRALSRLGPLGLDLGRVVAGDLRRIRRALERDDYKHAELSARDLAARLARPEPSFAGGGGGGTEAGSGASGAGGEPGDQEASDAESSVAAGEQAIDELSRDHAGNVADVEHALEQADGGEGPGALKDEAKRHAEAVREAVRRLPRSSFQPDAAAQAAAAARDQAQQMADALERGAPRDALEAGKAAERALQEAARAAADEGRWDGDRLERAAREASSKLGPEVRWLEQALEAARQKARQKTNVGGAAERESKLAERAGEVGEKGRSASGALPEQTLDLLREAERHMREAAQQLERGEGEAGLARQREAQRLLEMARSAEEDDEGGQGKKGQGPKGSPSGETPIPKAGEGKGPEEFRRRVLEGLGRGGDPRLRPAVKRYAERLLR